MPLHPFDLLYAGGLLLASPFWLLKRSARAKVFSAFQERMARLPTAEPGAGGGTRVLIHAVSLGEINATRTLVSELLSRRGDLSLIVSATTATGHARAVELYGSNPRVTVARYPLDFTGAVTRFLDRYKPALVVLMELELWPNFLRVCAKRDIPVVLANGRLTNHSLRRYRIIGPLSRRMLGAVRLVCAQDDIYRERFIRAGAHPDHVIVAGTMKFDTAQLSTDPEKVAGLRQAMGLGDIEPLLVCGSTGPGEEALLLATHKQLLQSHPTLRLALIPRKPERFEEVARLIEEERFPLIRRSNPQSQIDNRQSQIPLPLPVLLGDTMGELRLFYAMATVVFVGRTLVDLGPKQHGSDMLEPAALGKPVLVGPFTGNFADAMHLLKSNKAIREVETAGELKSEIERLLTNPAAAEQLGEAARSTIAQGQGSTRRHADRIVELLPRQVTTFPVVKSAH